MESKYHLPTTLKRLASTPEASAAFPESFSGAKLLTRNITPDTDASIFGHVEVQGQQYLPWLESKLL